MITAYVPADPVKRVQLYECEVSRETDRLFICQDRCYYKYKHDAALVYAGKLEQERHLTEQHLAGIRTKLDAAHAQVRRIREVRRN